MTNSPHADEPTTPPITNREETPRPAAAVIPPGLVRWHDVPQDQVFLILNPQLHDDASCLTLLQGLGYENLVVVVPNGQGDSPEVDCLLMPISTHLLSVHTVWALSMVEWGSPDELTEVLCELERVAPARKSAGGLIVLGADIPQSSVLSRFLPGSLPPRVIYDSRSVAIQPLTEA